MTRGWGRSGEGGECRLGPDPAVVGPGHDKDGRGDGPDSAPVAEVGAIWWTRPSSWRALAAAWVPSSSAWRARRVASARATATSIASPIRVRHAAMTRSCPSVSALRASSPRSVVQTRAVSALTVAVRSRVIPSREMMSIRSAFRVPSALGARSCAVSVPMKDRATLMASRASDWLRAPQVARLLGAALDDAVARCRERPGHPGAVRADALHDDQCHDDQCHDDQCHVG